MMAVNSAIDSRVEDTSLEVCHILVVEDSDTQAIRLKLNFEARGWQVSRAATGAEARSLLASNGEGASFDLVLLDYHLPDAQGDELVREIRTSEEGIRHLPVLLLTASEEQDSELRGLSSGADDYVSKAAPLDVLLMRLQTLLRKSRAHAELADRYEREHRVAQVLQEALLSAAPSDAFPGLTVQMVYEPAWEEAQIGGDFYDIRAVGPGQAALMVGDVTGKGLQAATLTAEVKYALRAFLYEYPDPGRALSRLNDFLVEHSQQNPWANSAFVAVCMAVCDAATGEVRIAAGGAEPPLLLRWSPDGKVTAEEASVPSGLVLGILGEQEFGTYSVTLEPGDVILLFTDGITEARKRRGEMLGFEGVARVAREALMSHHGDATKLIGEIVSAAKAISGGQLLDDACIIALQRKPV